MTCFSLRTNGKPQCWCRRCFCDYWKEHYQRNKRHYFDKAKEHERKLREIIRQAKDRPCTDCGIQYPAYVMDFDHRPGEEKLFAIGCAGGQERLSLQRLLTEIAKCDLVCANCHRERTHQRRQNWPKKYRGKAKEVED